MTTKLQQAARQALEALSKCYPSDEYNAVIDALREALADTRSSIRSSIRSNSEYSEQEPVAWMSPGKERLEFSRKDTVYGSHTIPLYAAPVRTKDLTDEELNDMWYGNTKDGWLGLFRAVIAADREKNK